MEEKRSSEGKNAQMQLWTEGVGARQRKTPPACRGGKYLNICTTFKFRRKTRGFQKISRRVYDSRAAEKEAAGIGVPWEAAMSRSAFAMRLFCRLGSSDFGRPGGRGRKARRSFPGTPTPVRFARPIGVGLAVHYRIWRKHTMAKTTRASAQKTSYPLLDNAIAYITATEVPSTFPKPLRTIMTAEASRLRDGLPTREEKETAVLRFLMAEIKALNEPPEPTTPREIAQKALNVVPVKAGPPAPIRDAHHCIDLAARGLSVLLWLLDGASTQVPLDPDGLSILIEPIDTQVKQARRELEGVMKAAA